MFFKWRIELIKSDSKDIYNVTEDFYLNIFELSIQPEKKCLMVSTDMMKYIAVFLNVQGTACKLDFFTMTFFSYYLELHISFNIIMQRCNKDWNLI